MYINNLKGKYVQHLLSVDDMSEDFILEIWTNALKNKDRTQSSDLDKLIVSLMRDERYIKYKQSYHDKNMKWLFEENNIK